MSPAKPAAPARVQEEIPATAVEVLPPASARPARAGGFNDALPRLITRLLDNLFRIPGTQRRVGLNPILDLLPVLGGPGNAAATLVTSILILEGARRGLPRIVLTRMAGNVLLNGIVGIVPGVGSAFAFWFRATQRNYNLLQRHSGASLVGARLSTRPDWAFVLALLAGVLLIAGLFIALGLYVTYRLLSGTPW